MSAELGLGLILTRQSETGQFQLLLKGMGDQQHGSDPVTICVIMLRFINSRAAGSWTFGGKTSLVCIAILNGKMVGINMFQLPEGYLLPNAIKSKLLL